MLKFLEDYLSDFAELFYPNLCLACNEKLVKQEQSVCSKCRLQLPQTGYWNQADNAMARRFWGRVELQGVAALFEFRKDGQVQHLLHELKYRGRTDAGEFMGRMIGRHMLHPNSVIKNVDLIVPVPLHWKRLQSRGYNQCDFIAKGLSEVTGIPWSGTALERVHANISQTKKRRFDRWSNVAEIFAVKDAAQLNARHILLVDDVMTTGATAEACLQQILSIPGAKASFVSAAAVK